MFDLNLTQMEILALAAECNLADGHPRQCLTDSQRKIIDQLPALFHSAGARDVDELERDARSEYFAAVGQHVPGAADQRPLTAYSSSVMMSVVARLLAERQRPVGLIHPTFDNIPDLLIAHGNALSAIPEERVPELDVQSMAGLGAIFITSPNNPTGWTIDARRLSLLADTCARADVVLTIDACFRGLDARAQFDYYDILETSGAEYLVIEDTGKLWPVSELKLGFAAASARLGETLANALSDVLLSVSPLILALVAELARDAQAGGFSQLHGLIRRNREVVERAVSKLPGVTMPDADSRVSVARIQLPEGISGESMRDDLSHAGVHVLPCGPFHWTNPTEGASMLRIALARNTSTVQWGMDRFVEAADKRLAANGRLAATSATLTAPPSAVQLDAAQGETR